MSREDYRALVTRFIPGADQKRCVELFVTERKEPLLEFETRRRLKQLREVGETEP